MTKIMFDCANCRQKELDRLKEIDDKANEGKRFFGKQKTKIDPKIYRKEAVEFTIVSEMPKKDIHDSSEEHPRAISGLKCICTDCGQATVNYINVGITDL